VNGGGVVRAALAGVATGARSFAAVTACASTPVGPSPLDRLLHRAWVRRSVRRSALGEVIADKLPVAPPRTAPAGLLARAVLGTVAGSVVAGRERLALPVGAAAGLAGALAWSFAGPPVRAALAERFGGDLPGALAEDAAAYGIAALAVRR